MQRQRVTQTCVAFSTQEKVPGFEFSEFLKPSQQKHVHVIRFNVLKIKT